MDYFPPVSCLRFRPRQVCISGLVVAAIALLSSTGSARAQERGWGDTWTKSRSERQRSREDAMREVVRAVKAKQYREAESRLEALIKQTPERVDVRMMSAGVHAVMQRYDAALADCAQAIALLQAQEPRALGEIYVARAQIYQAMRKPVDARADLERALRLDKQNAQYNNNLAWFLATSPEASLRDGPLAVKYAQTAQRLSGKNDFEVLDTLAAAEAEAGNFALAAKHEREALALAKGKNIRGGDKRLTLYEKQQPYREQPRTGDLLSE